MLCTLSCDIVTGCLIELQCDIVYIEGVIPVDDMMVTIRVGVGLFGIAV